MYHVHLLVLCRHGGTPCTGDCQQVAELLRMCGLAWNAEGLWNNGFFTIPFHWASSKTGAIFTIVAAASQSAASHTYLRRYLNLKILNEKVISGGNMRHRHDTA